MSSVARPARLIACVMQCTLACSFLSFACSLVACRVDLPEQSFPLIPSADTTCISILNYSFPLLISSADESFSFHLLSGSLSPPRAMALTVVIPIMACSEECSVSFMKFSLLPNLHPTCKCVIPLRWRCYSPFIGTRTYFFWTSATRSRPHRMV